MMNLYGLTKEWNAEPADESNADFRGFFVICFFPLLKIRFILLLCKTLFFNKIVNYGQRKSVPSALSACHFVCSFSCVMLLHCKTMFFEQNIKLVSTKIRSIRVIRVPFCLQL